MHSKTIWRPQFLNDEANDQLRNALGDAGELAIMSALRRGGRPRHVALISDRYGYDVENDYDGAIERLEVKTSLSAMSSRIFLSRNEFDVVARYKGNWRLVQVVFSGQVIPQRQAVATDVEAIRELSGSMLHSMSPTDSDAFTWMKAARFSPRPEDWMASRFKVEDEFIAVLPA